MTKHKKKAQAWSIDLTIGIILFLLVVSLFYIIFTKNNSGDVKEIQAESESLASRIFQFNSPINLVNNGKVDSEKVNKLLSEDYKDIKKDIGTDKEFCIVMRDKDGNIIPFRDENGNEYLGIGPGTGELNFSGKECGSLIIK